METTSDGQKATLADAVADEKNRNRCRFRRDRSRSCSGPETAGSGSAEAARGVRHDTHLYVIGFAVQPNPERSLSPRPRRSMMCPRPKTVAPDVVMGDLLKTTRASQVFSVAGPPDIELKELAPERAGGGLRAGRFSELLGLDRGGDGRCAR